MNLGIFTIVFENQKFMSFAIHKASWADGKLLLSKVTRPVGETEENEPQSSVICHAKCSCNSFEDVPKCERHKYFSFAFVSPAENTIKTWERWSGKIEMSSGRSFNELCSIVRRAYLFHNAEDEFEFTHNEENFTFMWSVPCRRCNEPLTNPVSIRDEIGPVCAERENAERTTLAEIAPQTTHEIAEIEPQAVFAAMTSPDGFEIVRFNEMTYAKQTITLDDITNATEHYRSLEFEVIRLQAELTTMQARRNTAYEELSRMRSDLRIQENVERQERERLAREESARKRNEEIEAQRAKDLARQAKLHEEEAERERQKTEARNRFIESFEGDLI